MGRSSEKLRAEFNSRVKEIEKRLKALKKHDPSSVAFEKYNKYFKEATSKNASYRTLQKMNKKARQMLEGDMLTIEGQERAIAQAIDTLHEEGYTFVNRRNFNYFMRFLDDARARGIGSQYSSTQILDAVHEAKQKGMTDWEIEQNIARWERQLERDAEGKIIEQENPKPLRTRHYARRGK